MAGSAVICMGGKVAGALVFFASVDDNVLAEIISVYCLRWSRFSLTFPRLRPMRTDILLSLRSFGSCLLFSLSASRDRKLSLVSLPVPASLLSPCRLLLELDLRSDGNPKLSTEDFLWEPGVLGTVRDESLVGEPLVLRRLCVEVGAEGTVGEVDVGIAFVGGICILWEEERRKNGMDDGVRRLDCCLRIDEAGLRGAFCRADNPAVLLLPLEPVPGRLGNPFSRSGVLAVDDLGP